MYKALDMSYVLFNSWWLTVAKHLDVAFKHRFVSHCTRLAAQCRLCWCVCVCVWVNDALSATLVVSWLLRETPGT